MLRRTMLKGVAIFILLTGVTYSQRLPYCSEYDVPNGIAKFPDAKNIKNYFICENGTLISKQCKNGYIFDSTKHYCTSSIPIEPTATEATTVRHTEKSTIPPFYCPGSEEKNYPHEKDCQKFYHCENHISVLLTCPKYFLFDTWTSKCLLFWMANCYVKTTTLPQTTTTTIPPPTCPPDQTIDYPYPNSCQYYYHCEKGSRKIKKCNFIYLFDRTELKCRFFIFAHCSTSLKSNRYISSEIRSNPIDSKIDISVVSNIMKQECGPSDNFKKPYPGVCNKFYECYYGQINVYRCFFIFNFDPIDLKCKWYWKVNCKAVPTTTTTTTSKEATTSITTTSTAGYSTTGELSSLAVPTTTTTTKEPTLSSTLSSTTTAIRKYDREIDNLVNQPRLKFNEKLLTLEIYENSDTYTCPPHGIHDDIYPPDCHRYYHCDEGVLSIKKCSVLHNFDPISLICKWFFLVDCKLRPTTTPSTVTPTTYVTVNISTTTPFTTTLTTSHLTTKRHTRKTKHKTRPTRRTTKKTLFLQ